MNRFHLGCLSLLSLALPSALQAQYTINTAAGGGPNNVLATTVQLPTPSGLAIDNAGNVYYSSADQNRVYKRATDGKVYLVAGHGGREYGGDGGPAVNAGLALPRGLAVNAAGTFLYIADSENHVIRRIDLGTGIITSVAGRASAAGFDGDGGLATNSRLNDPSDVAVDSTGNLYIADSDNRRIRLVNASTQVITTFAGTGGSYYYWEPNPNIGDGGPAIYATFYSPSSIALGPSGILYISDGTRIRRVVNGVITAFAGMGQACCELGDGGPALSARFGDNSVIRTDAGGNLLIADAYNDRIRKIDVATSIITTVAGKGFGGATTDGGPAVDVRLDNPIAAVADATGNLYIAEGEYYYSNGYYYVGRVRYVAKASGIIVTIAGISGTTTVPSIGDGGQARDSSLPSPRAVTRDAAGNIFVAAGHRVRRIDAITGIITTYAGKSESGFSGDGGAASDATLNLPSGLAVDSASNLYISDTENHRIRRVTPGGIITTFAGTGTAGYVGDTGQAAAAQFTRPRGLAFDSEGNLYVADTGNRRVRRISTTGVITNYAGNGQFLSGDDVGDGGLAVDARLSTPTGVAVHPTTGNLFIADAIGRVRRVSGGMITAVAGRALQGYFGDGGPAVEARLSESESIAFDAAGNLYIADTGNQRIRRVRAGTNIIETVAGTGVFGMGGDGGLAVHGDLAEPVDVEVAADGRIFVADSMNNRVRVLIPSCQFTLASTAITLGPAASTQNFVGVNPNDQSCTWTASSDSPSWLQIISGANGTGSGHVGFSVTASGGTARMGTLTIAGLTYTVTQQATCSYALSANSASLTSAAQGPYSLGISAGNGCAWTAVSNSPWLTITGNASGTTNGTTHFTVGANIGAARTGTMTIAGQTYTVTQAGAPPVNPGPPSQVGVFRSATWLVDTNASFSWDFTDYRRIFGSASDRPVVGDWTNSGVRRLGVFRNGVWYLDINNNGVWDGTPTDAIAYFGTSGDIPVVGDWTATGRMRIGVFRNGTWILDLNEDRAWNGLPTDGVISFGTTGDIPVIGDWTGTGHQRIGIFRNGLWVVDVNGNNTYDGSDTAFTFGTAGDIPVIGDWTGSGRRRVGIFRNGLWVVDANGNNGYDVSDTSFWFGTNTDLPVTF